MLVLEVKPRDKQMSAEDVRRVGSVPAVFYGPKEESTPIAIDQRKLAQVWKEAGETAIVTLKGVGEDKDTLIHDAQFHPVTGRLLHVDFYVIEKGKKVKINVPLEFTGSAPAEKQGRILVKALHEVEIEVAPQELPHSLLVDLSKLESVGDHIMAREIKLPGSASLVTHADEIIVSVKEFKEEPVEVTPAPEIEILTAKPAEGEGEAEGEAASPPAARKEEKSAKS